MNKFLQQFVLFVVIAVLAVYLLVGFTSIVGPFLMKALPYAILIVIFCLFFQSQNDDTNNRA